MVPSWIPSIVPSFFLSTLTFPETSYAACSCAGR
jgi:hypothetical protein